MNSNSEKIHNKELIRLIQEKAPHFYIKDIQEIIEAEQEVWREQLSKGNTIKYGKLYQFSPVKKEPRKHYDGIHKRVITLPKRYLIKIEPLVDIKNMYKEGK